MLASAQFALVESHDVWEYYSHTPTPPCQEHSAKRKLRCAWSPPLSIATLRYGKGYFFGPSCRNSTSSGVTTRIAILPPLANKRRGWCGHWITMISTIDDDARRCGQFVRLSIISESIRILLIKSMIKWLWEFHFRKSQSHFIMNGADTKMTTVFS